MNLEHRDWATEYIKFLQIYVYIYIYNIGMHDIYIYVVNSGFNHEHRDWSTESVKFLQIYIFIYKSLIPMFLTVLIPNIEIGLQNLSNSCKYIYIYIYNIGIHDIYVVNSDVRDGFNHEHRDWSTESLKFLPLYIYNIGIQYIYIYREFRF